MKRSSAYTFWQHYFFATQDAGASWLARLSASQRLQMLDSVMQWEVTTPVSLKRLSRQHRV
ncbi:glucose uptake inhibitor SgrT [Franconibacter pulveris 1160]|uniref:Glucose uptake inhibitor SgrT n=2 Tax=Franconibacter TaxID=1649295 RepID=A0A0J8VRK6_9ENTR|nr:MULTISPECIES: glucose uptake inhibitor SgrT [Franconibacter]KMV35140.1 hypothetical protein ACH50_07805 [Franconibacter pulveris]MCK1969454.1 glucose uptake inhibitor SgrT [Franconibacter sp. IITDAS19]MEB5923782.1 glucose uptake inhibitor SgrT [Franconibacter daqui]GGD27809.1 hypothetical protein GCM10011513_26570 [Franconibacter daqui]HBI10230.1 glucose uptake inhibitor SgrT [Franconibacter pulveris]